MSLLHMKACELCWEIEKLPASELQTKISEMASDLRSDIIEIVCSAEGDAIRAHMTTQEASSVATATVVRNEEGELVFEIHDPACRESWAQADISLNASAFKEGTTVVVREVFDGMPGV